MGTDAMDVAILRWKPLFDKGLAAMGSVIVGNDEVIRLALIALLCNKAILLTSEPGRGKTMLVKAFQQFIKGATAGRIQCMPDLLPGDFIGRKEFDEAERRYYINWGSAILKNIVLFDEINRATEKALSAILQAFEEGLITIDGQTRALPLLHLVMGTRNPIEQRGTFPLPEAVLDRFILESSVRYPGKVDMIDLMAKVDIHDGEAKIDSVFEIEEVLEMQKFVRQMVATSPHAVRNYIDDLLRSTQVDLPEFKRLKIKPDRRNPDEVSRLSERDGQSFDELNVVKSGVSPRGSIWQLHVACAHALTYGRKAPTVEDVQATFLAANRHRVVMSRMAAAEGITSEDLLNAVLRTVEY
jgi:MoxR-like ATPase